MSAYLGLFLTAFLAASLLPAYSELLFAGLLLRGYDPLALWAWASAGNTLGSALNWAIARFLLRFEDRRWFPFSGRRSSVPRTGFSATASGPCCWPGRRSVATR